MSDDANNDPIGSSLGINPIQKTEKVQEIITDAHNDSAAKDFETARANINVMIDTAKEAIENLSQIEIVHKLSKYNIIKEVCIL